MPSSCSTRQSRRSSGPCGAPSSSSAARRSASSSTTSSPASSSTSSASGTTKRTSSASAATTGPFPTPQGPARPPTRGASSARSATCERASCAGVRRRPSRRRRPISLPGGTASPTCVCTAPRSVGPSTCSPRSERDCGPWPPSPTRSPSSASIASARTAMSRSAATSTPCPGASSGRTSSCASPRPT